MVLRHFVAQEESYRDWAKSQLDATFKAELGKANNRVQGELHIYLRQWHGAMCDLMASLTNAGLSTGKSLEGDSNFKALQKYLSSGLATFTVSKCTASRSEVDG